MIAAHATSTPRKYKKAENKRERSIEKNDILGKALNPILKRAITYKIYLFRSR